MFIGGTVALGRNPTPSASMRLFGFSITYVTVLFGAIAAMGTPGEVKGAFGASSLDEVFLRLTRPGAA